MFYILKKKTLVPAKGTYQVVNGGFREATFSLTFGKKIEHFGKNPQNWENKNHFWIGNDSLIRR